jgi:periplasmic mercuric ion binding protein
MKSIKLMIAALLVVIAGGNTLAQNQDNSKVTLSKTETIKVSGNCSMCKNRIEKAAKLEGVEKATWDKDTKTLTLVYNPSRVSSDEVQKNIALAGHDTEKYKSDDKVYNGLPACCHYERLK